MVKISYGHEIETLDDETQARIYASIAKMASSFKIPGIEIIVGFDSEWDSYLNIRVTFPILTLTTQFNLNYLEDIPDCVATGAVKAAHVMIDEAIKPNANS